MAIASGRVRPPKGSPGLRFPAALLLFELLERERSSLPRRAFARLGLGRNAKAPTAVNTTAAQTQPRNASPAPNLSLVLF